MMIFDALGVFRDGDNWTILDNWVDDYWSILNSNEYDDCSALLWWLMICVVDDDDDDDVVCCLG